MGTIFCLDLKENNLYSESAVLKDISDKIATQTLNIITSFIFFFFCLLKSLKVWGPNMKKKNPIGATQAPKHPNFWGHVKDKAAGHT